MVIAVDKNLCNAKVSALIDALAGACRTLLDEATRAAGCGINRAKSEIVLAAKWRATDSKNEFVWLGYSLELTNDLHLKFTDSRMTSRFRKALVMARAVFQYVHSIYVRWRIYRVYIAPIIEWFLATSVNKPIHDRAQRAKIESFQFQMLCLVTGASQRCSAAGLEHVCAEKPVRLKLRKFAQGLSAYVYRNKYDLLVGQHGNTTRRSTRSGAAASSTRWAGANHRDFGDRIFILADEHENTPKDTLSLYNPKSKSRLKFDPIIVRDWVRTANSEVRRAARARELGLEP